MMNEIFSVVIGAATEVGLAAGAAAVAVAAAVGKKPLQLKKAEGEAAAAARTALEIAQQPQPGPMELARKHFESTLGGRNVYVTSVKHAINPLKFFQKEAFRAVVQGCPNKEELEQLRAILAKWQALEDRRADSKANVIQGRLRQARQDFVSDPSIAKSEQIEKLQNKLELAKKAGARDGNLLREASDKVLRREFVPIADKILASRVPAVTNLAAEVDQHERMQAEMLGIPFEPSASLLAIYHLVMQLDSAAKALGILNSPRHFLASMGVEL